MPRWRSVSSDIKLTGIADRIDILGDGGAVLIDYKTGSSPSANEARALLDPQLALEAAALKAGAFKRCGRTASADPGLCPAEARRTI